MIHFTLANHPAAAFHLRAENPLSAILPNSLLIQIEQRCRLARSINAIECRNRL
jgi:hypothetical protein